FSRWRYAVLYACAVISPDTSPVHQFVRAFPGSIIGANRAAKDVVSSTLSLYDGTIQVPPTPAGPDRLSPSIRATGASPSIPFASTSEIPSRAMSVFSIRMLCVRSAGVDSVFSSTARSLASSFSHLNADLGGTGPSSLNQQRLPSMSRHHQ